MPLKKIFRSLKKALGGGSRPRAVDLKIAPKNLPRPRIGPQKEDLLSNLAGSFTPEDFDSSQIDKKTGAIRLGAGGIPPR